MKNFNLSNWKRYTNNWEVVYQKTFNTTHSDHLVMLLSFYQRVWKLGIGMFLMHFSSSAVVCVHYWILEGQHFTFELPKVVGDKS